MKTAVVKPVHKSGPKTNYNNYRPISILPSIEKILEEIMVRRLTCFLKKFNLINNNQYGFQRGKNINQLLGHFSSHINNTLEKKQHCLALFIDFSKAFDTISHEKLLSVLERYGIRGVWLQWFADYLKNRTFCVKIGEKQSSHVQLKCGVPQGSKLGPILYLLYANDLLNSLKNSKYFAYADDTAILVTHSNIKSAVNIMQSEFNIVVKWCHDNGLVLNAQKSNIMHIRSIKTPKSEILIKFHDYSCLHGSPNLENMDNCNTFIELCRSIKYLGVIVDDNFTWKEHILNINKKLRKAAYAQHHLNKCAPI